MLIEPSTTNTRFSPTLSTTPTYHSEAPPAPAENFDEKEGAPEGGLTDADIESNWEEAIDAFDGMELPEELLRGIYAYGFEKPSAIQQRAIKPTILGKDLIAQAQSGTVSHVCHAVNCRRMVFLEFLDGVVKGMMILFNHLSSLNRVILNVSDNFNSKTDLLGSCPGLCDTCFYFQS